MSGTDILFPNLGIEIANLPKGFTIGGFTIACYGIIMAVSMLAGLGIVCWQAKRTGQNKELYMDFAIYAIIFSLIGARLYYVAFSWDYYKDNLLQIFNTRGGGMALYGSVIGAILTAVIYCRIKKCNFFLLADTGVVGLILGQIIGRYGNFFNREAFGEYTDGLFAMRLRVDQVNPSNITELMREHMQTIDGVSYIQVHPTFLYESMWNIVVLVLMLFYTKKKKFHGEIFILYMVGYALGRVWIEGLRTDQLQIGSTGIAVSQVLAGVIAVVGIIVWIGIRLSLRKKGVGAVSSEKMAAGKLEFLPVEKGAAETIDRLSLLAGAIVKEHYDPIIGAAQNDYMIERFQSPEAITRDLERGDTYCIIRERETGEEIGYFACYPKEGKWYLNKYYLKKEKRGRGYGSETMERVQELGRQAGFSEMFLNVNKHNDESIAIYEHLGFTLLREEKNPIGNDYYMDDYVLQCKL